MKNRGAVLIAVLVMVAMAGMVAAGLLFHVRTGASAFAAIGNGEQAYSAAISGVQRAMIVLKEYSKDMAIWYDNPELFAEQLVYDDGINRWYFTIYAHDPEDSHSVRYGLIDERGKININTAEEETLRALPNMTSELVDCLLDYRDRDGETRTNGAEQDYYERLPYPYVIKNSYFTSLEELLLVKGFNASIIYGEDVNLNGTLESNEDDGHDRFPPDNRDGMLDGGLRAVATAVGYDRTQNASPAPSGRVRWVNLNTAPAEVLALLPGMDYESARSIVAVRSTLDPRVTYTYAWLREYNVISEEAYGKVRPFLAMESSHYRVQCVGFGVPSGRFRVLEAVIHLTRGEPRITYLRDITRLGVPIALNVQE